MLRPMMILESFVESLAPDPRLKSRLAVEPQEMDACESSYSNSLSSSRRFEPQCS